MATDWPKKFITWFDDNTAFVSVPFTWDLCEARDKAIELKASGYEVRMGGPAVDLVPSVVQDVAVLGGSVDAITRFNPYATFTSRGCIRRCPFCAVWRTEGFLKELKDWPIRPIVCDNNLLACSKTHFDDVIEKLKPLVHIVDFNQGLDARLLTKYHADRLSELDCIVRLAWDNIDLGNKFMAAYEKLRKVGIPKRRIRAYVLIGFNDTPQDAWFRLRTLRNMGIMPNPMRYQPVDTMEKNSYVAENWTHKTLIAFMRYWARLRFTGSIPFEEWLPVGCDVQI